MRLDGPELKHAASCANQSLAQHCMAALLRAVSQLLNFTSDLQQGQPGRQTLNNHAMLRHAILRQKATVRGCSHAAIGPA